MTFALFGETSCETVTCAICHKQVRAGLLPNHQDTSARPGRELTAQAVSSQRQLQAGDPNHANHLLCGARVSVSGTQLTKPSFTQIPCPWLAKKHTKP